MKHSGLSRRVAVYALGLMIVLSALAAGLANHVLSSMYQANGHSLARQLALQAVAKIDIRIGHELDLIAAARANDSIQRWIISQDADPRIRQPGLAAFDRLVPLFNQQKPTLTFPAGPSHYRYYSTLRSEGINTFTMFGEVERQPSTEWFWRQMAIFRAEPQRPFWISSNLQTPQNILKLWISTPVRHEGQIKALLGAGLQLNEAQLTIPSETLDYQLRLIPFDTENMMFEQSPNWLPKQAQQQVQAALDAGTTPAYRIETATYSGFGALAPIPFCECGVGIRLQDNKVAQTRYGRWLILGLFGLIAGFLMLTLWWVRTQLVRPLESITRWIGRISQGHLEDRPDMTFHHEFHNLEQGIESMVEELSDYRQEMEGLVAQRTRELRMQRDLAHQAYDKERAMLAQHTRFADLIAHEFRNPLAIITSNAQLLDLRLQKASPQLAAINQGAERLQTLFEQWLTRTQLQRGGLPYCPELVDVSMLVNACIPLVTGLDSKRVELHQDESLPLLMADPALLRSALINLLENAVKYSDPDTPITVSLQQQGDTVRIRVHNRGEAIPLHLQAYIFESYARVKPESRLRGLGLGLYIVRHIMELHAGEVLLDSAPETGTTFTLIIPVSPPAPGPEEPTDTGDTNQEAHDTANTTDTGADRRGRGSASGCDP